jgi:hypothetical protein
MTLEQAKELKAGQKIFVKGKMGIGMILSVKSVKTWKKDASRILIKASNIGYRMEIKGDLQNIGTENRDRNWYTCGHMDNGKLRKMGS